MMEDDRLNPAERSYLKKQIVVSEEKEEDIKQGAGMGDLRGLVYERYHLFMDRSVKSNKIESFLKDVNNEYPHAFLEEQVTEDNLEQILSRAERNYNIAYTPESVAGLRLDLNDHGEDNGFINLWPRKSFTWQLDVCRDNADEKVDIEEIVQKRVNGSYPYQGIKELAFDHFTEEILLSAVVFDIFHCSVEFDAVYNELQKDLTLPTNLGLPPGHVSASLVNNDCLVVMVQSSEEKTRLNSQFYILVFHRYDKKKMACTGEIDYVYDILQLISCSELLRDKVEEISALEGSLSTTTDEAVKVLEKKDPEERHKRLKNILMELVNYRRRIIQMDREVGDTLKFKESMVDKLKNLDDIKIRNSAFSTAVYIVEDVEKDIEVLNKDLSENIESIRNVIRENLRSDTMLGVARTYNGISEELEVEQDMDNAIQSMHAMHATLFILEFILFSEFFVSIIEHLPAFEHGGSLERIILIGAATFLGIISAYILTTIARKANFPEKLAMGKKDDN